MSTFVDIKRIISASDKTTAIRLDDDLKITVRTEKTSTHTDHQANFSGVQEGQSIATTDPIAWIQVAKDNDTEVAIIGVNVYHAEDEHDTVPAEGQYWYNPTTHYWPDTAAQPGKTLAPDPSFKDAVQAFPTTIFNISTAGNLITGNTVAATTISADEIINTRRSLLKNKINMILNDPMLPAIVGFASFNPIGSITVEAQTQTILQMDAPRRLQSFWFWLEMLTRAISINSNLSSDEKYVLLNGEISLNIWDVFGKLNRTLANDIAGANPRTGWDFRRFGSVSQANSQAPWVYTPPAQASVWNTVHDTGIDIGSSAAVTQYNWITWLRT